MHHLPLFCSPSYIGRKTSKYLTATMFCLATIGFSGEIGAGSTSVDNEDIQARDTGRVDKCHSYNKLKEPFFGETHLHTSMSVDASMRLVPTTPRQAYAFAKGEGFINLVDEHGRIQQENQIRIDRPLDWGAVTDHAEFFSEMGLCKYAQFGDPDKPEPKGFNSLDCRLLTGSYWKPSEDEAMDPRLPGMMTKMLADNAFNVLNAPSMGPSSRNVPIPLCISGEASCDLSLWQEMQDAAEWANDPCTFTSFIGYEVTSTPGGTNWHRNVIFANENVIERPITAIDMARKRNPNPNIIPPQYFGAPDVTKLWDGLQVGCLDKKGSPQCDVLTIPHNSNLGGGVHSIGKELVPPLFFNPEGRTEEEQRQHAKQRQQFEPLVEIYQAKGSSECRWDPRANQGTGGGVDTNDEFCDFELLDRVGLRAADSGENQAPPLESFPRRSYVRNVLKDGLKLKFKEKLGVNPFKLGIVAASDSHNGDMGWRAENENFSGHSGVKDAIPVTSNIQGSSGGLSVVWAEENTRKSIFAALKRREAYGTSGTRIKVRFFGGWDFSEAACNSGNALIQAGYDRGVPMGSDLPPATSLIDKATGPQFIVKAEMDDFIGTPLDRIQIIKGWLDSEGNTHEKVIHVAGDATTDTRIIDQSGYETLCNLYTDKDFDPTRPAFYYVRVLEKPVYRYSTHYCRVHFGVDPLSENCEDQLSNLKDDAIHAKQCCNNETTAPIVQPVIQERAWTSPIWYTPQ